MERSAKGAVTLSSVEMDLIGIESYSMHPWNDHELDMHSTFQVCDKVMHSSRMHHGPRKRKETHGAARRCQVGETRQKMIWAWMQSGCMRQVAKEDESE